jgi:hypothetical protein
LGCDKHQKNHVVYGLIERLGDNDQLGDVTKLELYQLEDLLQHELNYHFLIVGMEPIIIAYVV